MFEKFNEVENFFNERKAYGIKPGLERMFYMLKNMKHPEKAIKAIHIAGTNGKGSTAEFIKSGLIENDYRVGLFTSPSFHGLCGHIFINNKMISESDFIKLLNELYPIIEELDDLEQYPTEFEIITVIGFLYFNRFADISIIEAGMGGRGDTTNCFIPILSIITSISLDHTQFLGNTIEKIAYHKAGIIKFERPVIVGDLQKSVLKVIEDEATGQHSKVYKLNREFCYELISLNEQKQVFNWKFDNNDFASENVVEIQLKGLHQLNNASLAVATLTLLKNAGIKLDDTKYLRGMALAKLPGRFEVISKHPSIVLDGAHNPDGIVKFVDAAKKYSRLEDRHVLFACFKDKDMNSMLEQMNNQFTSVTIANFNHPRSYSDEGLIAKANELNYNYELNWKSVIDRAFQEKDNHESRLFITGSLHFILQVRNYINSNYNKGE